MGANELAQAHDLRDLMPWLGSRKGAGREEEDEEEAEANEEDRSPGNHGRRLVEGLDAKN